MATGSEKWKKQNIKKYGKHTSGAAKREKVTAVFKPDRVRIKSTQVGGDVPF